MIPFYVFSSPAEVGFPGRNSGECRIAGSIIRWTNASLEALSLHLFPYLVILDLRTSKIRLFHSRIAHQFFACAGEHAA
jgi:hypothetical protein